RLFSSASSSSVLYFASGFSFGWFSSSATLSLIFRAQSLPSTQSITFVTLSSLILNTATHFFWCLLLPSMEQTMYRPSSHSLNPSIGFMNLPSNAYPLLFDLSTDFTFLTHPPL